MDHIRSSKVQNSIQNMSKIKTVKKRTADISTADSFVKTSKSDNQFSLKNSYTEKNKVIDRMIADSMSLKDWADAAVQCLPYISLAGVVGALAGAGTGACIALIAGAKITHAMAIFAGTGAVGLPISIPFIIYKYLK